MSRDLTPSVQTEIAKAAVQPIIFVQMDFDITDGGSIYLWSGLGPISWDAKSWVGVGDLGSISPVRETSATQSEGMTFKLSGIPVSILSAAFVNYQGRAVTMWLGFMDDNTIVSDPLQLFLGRMDVMEIEESGDVCSITISAESHMVDLLKAREWRYTHEDQQTLYPGDLGLEFVAELQDKQILWGYV